MYIHDETRVKQIIDLFLEFVSKKNNGEKVSFSSGYLFQNEGYKAAVYVHANDILKPESWNQKMIKSGEIAKRMNDAIHIIDNNFTGWRSKDNFRKAAQARPVEAGKAAFDLFRTDDDPASLEGIVSFMGTRNYDLISTMFYMKNPDLYYPCRPRFFRQAFTQLGMDTNCFNDCTYENYAKFNDEIRELADFFSAYAGHIDVLNAHSFAWILGAYDEAKAYIFDEEGDPKADDDMKEGTTQVKVRLRQSEYRRGLMEYWGGKCAVTGCGLTDILIASHAKPWRKCETNSDSISKYNGFLLTPNMDRLFDGGYISFDDEGKILISSLIPEKEIESIGLRKDMRLRKIEEGHLKYLAYHREDVFRG